MFAGVAVGARGECAGSVCASLALLVAHIEVNLRAVPALQSPSHGSTGGEAEGDAEEEAYISGKDLLRVRAVCVAGVRLLPGRVAHCCLHRLCLSQPGFPSCSFVAQGHEGWWLYSRYSYFVLTTAVVNFTESTVRSLVLRMVGVRADSLCVARLSVKPCWQCLVEPGLVGQPGLIGSVVFSRHMRASIYFIPPVPPPGLLPGTLPFS